MTRIAMLTLLLAVSSAAAAQSAGPAAEPAGQAIVEKNCSSCHPVTQVTSAHKSKDDWGATLDKMIGFGAQIPDKEYDAIVDYLAAHQGVVNK